MSNSGVQLGCAVMTMVDPNRGREKEFNQWYERDHLYGGASLGPSVFSAGRFAARRSEKLVRKVTDGCDPDIGTLLALYWLVGDGADYWSWSAGNVKRLAAEGRLSPSGTVRMVQFLRDPVTEQPLSGGVPPEVALDRRFRGVVVTYVTDVATTEDYLESSVRPLVADGAAELCLLFSPTNAMGAVRGGQDDGDMLLRFESATVALWFVDDDPSKAGASLIAAHNEALQQSGSGWLRWASPFIGTVPGTDTHMDSLWLEPKDRSVP